MLWNLGKSLQAQLGKAGSSRPAGLSFLLLSCLLVVSACQDHQSLQDKRQESSRAVATEVLNQQDDVGATQPTTDEDVKSKADAVAKPQTSDASGEQAGRPQMEQVAGETPVLRDVVSPVPDRDDSFAACIDMGYSFSTCNNNRDFGTIGNGGYIHCLQLGYSPFECSRYPDRGPSLVGLEFNVPADLPVPGYLACLTANHSPSDCHTYYDRGAVGSGGYISCINDNQSPRTCYNNPDNGPSVQTRYNQCRSVGNFPSFCSEAPNSWYLFQYSGYAACIERFSTRDCSIYPDRSVAYGPSGYAHCIERRYSPSTCSTHADGGSSSSVYISCLNSSLHPQTCARRSSPKDIDGTWYRSSTAGYPLVEIDQRGGAATITQEGQGPYEVIFDGDDLLRIPGSFVTGRINSTAQQIVWSNGVVYQRAPDLSQIPNMAGTWLESTTRYAEAIVSQAGHRVTLVSSSGLRVDGVFRSPDSILFFNGRIATFADNNTRMRFNAEDNLYKVGDLSNLPDLSGSWLNGREQFEDLVITQSGNKLQFLYQNGNVFFGAFLNRHEIVGFSSHRANIINRVTHGTTVLQWSNANYFYKTIGDVSNAVDITGDWQNGRDNFSAVRVEQVGSKVTFFYPNNQVFYGGFLSNNILAGFTGLTGSVSNSDGPIQWSNNNTFNRPPPAESIPDVSGRWINRADLTDVDIVQNAQDLTITHASGQSYPGVFFEVNKLRANGLDGTVNAAVSRIDFNNGNAFERPATLDNVANIAGRWISTTDYTIVAIAQDGLTTTFTYADGSEQTAEFLLAATFRIDQNGVRGSVEPGSNRIQFTNGVTFIREPNVATLPDISGTWLHAAQNFDAIEVEQVGGNVTFTYPDGTVYTGIFLEPNHLHAFDGLFGDLVDNDQTLQWSNGVTFTKAPQNVVAIAGNWLSVGEAYARVVISQEGGAVSFLRANGDSFTGRFISERQFVVNGSNGTVSLDGQTIQWGDGNSYVMEPQVGNLLPIAGQWIDLSALKLITITVDQTDLAIEGTTHVGYYIANNQIRYGHSEAIGTIGNDEIVWSDGVRYVRPPSPDNLPQLAGDWLFAQSNNQLITILQNGIELIFDYNNGNTYTGFFLSDTEIAGFDRLRATIGNDQLTWSNGSIFNKVADPEPLPEPGDVPDLTGVWLNHLDNFSEIVIQQDGINLTFVYPNGQTYSGSFTSPSAIRAFGSLAGSLSNDDAQIDWSNGNVFSKKPADPDPEPEPEPGEVPDLAGVWLNHLDNFSEIVIQQDGENLTFVYPTQTYAGSFNSPTEISAFSGLTGTLSNDNTQINWSNGNVFTKKPADPDPEPEPEPGENPDLSGVWVNHLDNFSEIVVEQDGDNLTFVYPSQTYAGTFNSPTEISAFGSLTGTLSNGNTQINWSNGNVFTRGPAIPDVSGSWTNLSGGPNVNIVQNGARVTLNYSNGTSQEGVFSSSTEIQSQSTAGPVSGTYNAVTGRITWSNGVVFAKD